MKKREKLHAMLRMLARKGDKEELASRSWPSMAKAKFSRLHRPLMSSRLELTNHALDALQRDSQLELLL